MNSPKSICGKCQKEAERKKTTGLCQECDAELDRWFRSGRAGANHLGTLHDISRKRQPEDPR